MERTESETQTIPSADEDVDHQNSYSLPVKMRNGAVAFKDRPTDQCILSPHNTLLGVCQQMENDVHPETCTWIFIVALFTTLLCHPWSHSGKTLQHSWLCPLPLPHLRPPLTPAWHTCHICRFSFCTCCEAERMQAAHGMLVSFQGITWHFLSVSRRKLLLSPGKYAEHNNKGVAVQQTQLSPCAPCTLVSFWYSFTNLRESFRGFRILVSLAKNS